MGEKKQLLRRHVKLYGVAHRHKADKQRFCHYHRLRSWFKSYERSKIVYFGISFMGLNIILIPLFFVFGSRTILTSFCHTISTTKTSLNLA